MNGNLHPIFQEILEPYKNPHAVALGTLGGKVKSQRKALSSKKNGSLGGRPKQTEVSKESAR